MTQEFELSLATETGVVVEGTNYTTSQDHLVNITLNNDPVLLADMTSQTHYNNRKYIYNPSTQNKLALSSYNISCLIYDGSGILVHIFELHI